MANASLREVERQLAGAFSADPVPASAYDQLVAYFARGWLRYASRDNTGAAYPGWASRHGRRADLFEGFARLFPLFGAWVASGRPQIVGLVGQQLNIPSTFQQGLLVGTDRSAAGYWGDVADRDQRIVEAADVALSLWLLRDSVWEDLTAAEQNRVVSWLSEAADRQTYDNNWHIFPVLIRLVLRALGRTIDGADTSRRYARLVSFHKGEGWLSDGEHGSFDYYNAWGFHYGLYWIDQIDPSWDRSFIESIRADFLAGYRYLIGPEGFPIMGRSACYRVAAAAPLVFGHASSPELVSVGHARRALDCTWRYFLNRGALRGGNVTQGYFAADPRIVENYSGPASCLWSLRSLIPAYYLPRDHEFWRSSGDPLPVECGDYRVEIPTIGWTILGCASSREIRLELAGGGHSAAQVERHGFVRRLVGLAVGKPQRPDNYSAKYGRRTYSSANPYFELDP